MLDLALDDGEQLPLGIEQHPIRLAPAFPAPGSAEVPPLASVVVFEVFLGPVMPLLFKANPRLLRVAHTTLRALLREERRARHLFRPDHVARWLET